VLLLCAIKIKAEQNNRIMKDQLLLAISAVTFDDFNTLRYGVDEEDIIHPIFRALKRRVKVEEKDFLNEYFRADKAYRRTLQETFRESLLDDIIRNVLLSLGHRSPKLHLIVRGAVNEGLTTRNAVWYPDAFQVLTILRKRGYKLGLITNTHWRLLDETEKEFKKFFDVITLSYEHGYAKPHPSIFSVTLRMLGINANNCLHVGDDPIADVEGAKKVGMTTAFIKRGKRKANADIQIEQLSELMEFL
jgi:HAD superfamily hydrolase (TIGR01509 family)